MKNPVFCFIMLIGLIHTSMIDAQKPELRFGRDKKFKIVQFTDVHYLPGNVESETPLRTINAVLDAEKPDLVVFTGDIVTGPPVESGWKIITKLVIDRRIPYAIVLGNHDDESDWSRKQIATYLEPLPYSLFISKAADITGYGNYVLPVKSSSGDKAAALLYCFDSNTYNTVDTIGVYDWIHPDQISWYQSESARFKEQNNGKPLPSLSFFHIPLPEYFKAYTNEQYQPIGLRIEEECSPKHNTGLFDTMNQCGDVMAIFTGHDHDNDYIAYLDGIALGYGRFTGGKTIYGDLESGARIIILTEGSRSFRTYIRTASGKIYGNITIPQHFISKDKN
jgi:3',5'-cyclic AMP phosphodiesterase CpdA